jgi:hypothetical protein
MKVLKFLNNHQDRQLQWRSGWFLKSSQAYLVVGIRHRYHRGTLLEIRRGDVSSFWYGEWSEGELEVSG